MKTEENFNRWINSEKVSKQDKEFLLKMDEKAKDDAFFKDLEFGTAGMRGVIGPGTNRLNEFTVKKATVAFGMYLKEKFSDACEKGVAISHDNRHRSREFTLECVDILNKMGINTFIFDSLRPTPELSYAVRYVSACGGIMITASHNPKEHNGYKVYDPKGCQLLPDDVSRLIEIIASLPDELSVDVPEVEHKGINKIFDSKIDDDYVEEVKKIQVHPELNKEGFKIVYSPEHGTSYENAIRVFKELGYEIYPVLSQCTHDPDFSGTLSPNPENEEAYIEAIKLAKEIKAQLIVVTDPDGDRVGVGYLTRDGEYKLFTGNQSAALLAYYVFSEKKKKGTLSSNGVMYDTIVSSSLASDVAKSFGVNVETFLTGFKYIGSRIGHYEEIPNSPKFEFGYEESYGCLLAPFVRDKDGIQAILMYAEMALFNYRNGKLLDEAFEDLQKEYGFHDTLCKSIYFEGSDGAAKMASIMAAAHKHNFDEIAGIKIVKINDYSTQISKENGIETKIELPKSDVVKFFLEDGSTVTIRPSGTEPKCKFYIESVAKIPANLQQKSLNLYNDFLKKVNG